MSGPQGKVLAWAVVFGLGLCLGASDQPHWHSLFNGKNLDGWKASENQGAFSVKDGILIVHGKRSHLFYTGPVSNATFTNFHFQAEVKTFPKANSGLYFHTEYQEKGWPAKGYESQVNNSHKDQKKTGGLYAVQDTFQAPANDGEWFVYDIIVKGQHIETRVNGKTIISYTEPAGLQRERMPGRLLSSGTFAIQAHDPNSIVHYRNIRVKLLSAE